MFGRKSATPSESVSGQSGAESGTQVNPEGKGRATPTRKEAEAARLAKVRPARTRKEQAQRDRAARNEEMSKRREAMKTGDEKYLPTRDRGPVRRFVRDFIDSRFMVSEILLPVLIVAMFLNFTKNASLIGLATMLMFTMIFMTAINFAVIVFKLRRGLDRMFPETSTKGSTWYALTRALQMRFLRMPKPQIRIGEDMPDSYR